MDRSTDFNKNILENGLVDDQPVPIKKVDPSLRILRLTMNIRLTTFHYPKILESKQQQKKLIIIKINRNLYLLDIFIK